MIHFPSSSLLIFSPSSSLFSLLCRSIAVCFFLSPCGSLSFFCTFFLPFACYFCQAAWTCFLDPCFFLSFFLSPLSFCAFTLFWIVYVVVLCQVGMAQRKWCWRRCAEISVTWSDWIVGRGASYWCQKCKSDSITRDPFVPFLHRVVLLLPFCFLSMITMHS